MTEEIEITLKHAAAIWWSTFWRAVLLALVFGLIAGFIVGIMGGVARKIIQPENPAAYRAWVLLISGFMGLCCGAYAHIRVIKHIIAHKHFNGFRIALVSTKSSYH